MKKSDDKTNDENDEYIPPSYLRRLDFPPQLQAALSIYAEKHLPALQKIVDLDAAEYSRDGGKSRTPRPEIMMFKGLVDALKMLIRNNPNDKQYNIGFIKRAMENAEITISGNAKTGKSNNTQTILGIEPHLKTLTKLTSIDAAAYQKAKAALFEELLPLWNEVGPFSVQGALRE